MESNYRIEFDVWGTFTDRALVSGENVLAKAKAFTLEDVTGEVVAVLDKILEESAISSTYFSI